jgi:hypothetical protein
LLVLVQVQVQVVGVLIMVVLHLLVLMLMLLTQVSTVEFVLSVCLYVCLVNTRNKGTLIS